MTAAQLQLDSVAGASLNNTSKSASASVLWVSENATLSARARKFCTLVWRVYLNIGSLGDSLPILAYCALINLSNSFTIAVVPVTVQFPRDLPHGRYASLQKEC